MSDAQHTPGKWGYDGEDTAASQDWDGDGYEIFVRDGNGEIIESIASTTEEADARLIAAAPDLLEALETVERQASQSGEASPRITSNALRDVRAAIQKARGHV